MIEVSFTDEDLKKAQIKAKEMGKLRNSITSGEGNAIGFLGEMLFVKEFGGENKNTYDYDVILDGKKIDVKTKSTTVEPRPHYFCTVANYNTKQKCDEYYFVRIDLKKKLGYLIGGLPKDEFYQKATFYKKGDEDPSSDNGWKFKADCYNLAVEEIDK